jgi:hypothetical protein
VLHGNLQLGMRADAVRPMWSSLAARGFALHGYCGASQVCTAEAPLEFGARNWVLYLQFEQERLSGARVRTEDSVFEHPAQAPPDLGQWREASE